MFGCTCLEKSGDKLESPDMHADGGWRDSEVSSAELSLFESRICHHTPWTRSFRSSRPYKTEPPPDLEIIERPNSKFNPYF